MSCGADAAWAWEVKRRRMPRRGMMIGLDMGFGNLPRMLLIFTDFIWIYLIWYDSA